MQLYELERDSQGHIFWKQEQINFIIDSYTSEKYNMSELARLFKTKQVQIKKILCSNNVDLRTNVNQKHSRNSYYFNEIDSPVKAYWLGFLMADGNVQYNKKNKCVRLEVSKVDYEHVHSFKNEIKSSAPIYFNRDDLCGITIYDKTIADDLIKWGCTPNKTHTLEYPKNIKYHKAFILGYFDGDGCLTRHFDGKYKRFKFSIIGTQEFLIELVKHLTIINNKFRMPLAHRCKNTYSLEITGNERIYIVMKELYNSCNEIYLKRKYEKFIELESYLLR
ncbi:hypothetical protein [Bacillus smithii]|uniref:hypothetical protein n=1 Tax=Bacillus smithii TaxID=1479 RepID=UPI003D22591C